MTERDTKTMPRHKPRLTCSLIAIGCALAIMPAATAKVAGDGASSIVTEAVARTVTALDDARISDSEADSILELVDVERVAQFALGNHWQDLTEDQQSRYLDAFHDYATAQLKTHLSGFSEAEVEISDVNARGDTDSIVETLVTTEGERQTVSWRVMKQDEWNIVDIEVQDVWFAIEQRAQFDAILDKNGGDVDALIAEIGS